MLSDKWQLNAVAGVVRVSKLHVARGWCNYSLWCHTQQKLQTGPQMHTQARRHSDVLCSKPAVAGTFGLTPSVLHQIVR